MVKRDLTSGSILTGVLSLSVPMIASHVIQSIQSMVDLYFVGRLGPEAIAAVGMGGTVSMVMATVFMGIHTSTVAMVSRAVGAKDEARASQVAGQAMVLTAVFSVLVTAAGYAASPFLLRLLGAQGEVAQLGTEYLRIIFLGMFFMCAAFVIGGILQAAGDAVTPFLLSVLVTVCNVILTPILIFGHLGFPEMGVSGSAMATVVARTVSFGVWVVALAFGRLRIRMALADLKPRLDTIWQMTLIAIPSSLQMTIRSAMNIVLMTIVAQFGTLVVAAYSIGMRIQMLGLFPIFGFAAAAATMVGQNLGAGRPERAQKSVYVATVVSFLCTAVAVLAFVFFASQLTALFNDDAGVVAVGASFLRITAIGICAASVGIVFGRGLNGAGDTISPLIITLIALWGFQIPAAIYFSGVREIYGITIPGWQWFDSIATHNERGIWYAMIASSTLQSAMNVAWFMTGRWKKRKV